MRYLFGFICVLALGVMGSAMGCGEDQCAAACPGRGRLIEARLDIRMDPGVKSPYEADLVLDGATGAFTCGSYMAGGYAVSLPTNRTGSGESVYSECSGLGFTIVGTPASVEISINAQDGSWTGSVEESPNYERVTVCGTLCPPRAVVSVPKQ
jgi:hypothetical protein